MPTDKPTDPQPSVDTKNAAHAFRQTTPGTDKPTDLRAALIRLTEHHAAAECYRYPECEVETNAARLAIPPGDEPVYAVTASALERAMERVWPDGIRHSGYSLTVAAILRELRP